VVEQVIAETSFYNVYLTMSLVQIRLDATFYSENIFFEIFFFENHHIRRFLWPLYSVLRKPFVNKNKRYFM
jgi:hypothetical protein